MSYLDEDVVFGFIKDIKDCNNKNVMLMQTLRLVRSQESYNYSYFGKKDSYILTLVSLLQPATVLEKVNLYIISNDLNRLNFSNKSDGWYKQKSFELLTGQLSLYRMNQMASYHRRSSDFRKLADACVSELANQVATCDEKFSDFLRCLPMIFSCYLDYVSTTPSSGILYPSSGPVMDFAKNIGQKIANQPIKVFRCLFKIFDIIKQDKFCNVAFAIGFIKGIMPLWAREAEELVMKIDDGTERLKCVKLQLHLLFEKADNDILAMVLAPFKNEGNKEYYYSLLFKFRPKVISLVLLNEYIDAVYSSNKGAETTIKIYYAWGVCWSDILTHQEENAKKARENLIKSLLSNDLFKVMEGDVNNNQRFHSWSEICCFIIDKNLFSEREVEQIILLVFNDKWLSLRAMYTHFFDEVMCKLIEKYPERVLWFIYERYLAGLSQRRSFDRKEILNGILLNLQKNFPEVLKKFCINLGRACFIAQECNLLIFNKENERYEWTEVGLWLLKQFGTEQNLLDIIGTQIQSRYYHGDDSYRMSDYLQDKLYPLVQIINEGKDFSPAICVWANLHKRKIENDITSSKKDEAEKKQNIFYSYGVPNIRKLDSVEDAFETPHAHKKLKID